MQHDKKQTTIEVPATLAGMLALVLSSPRDQCAARGSRSSIAIAQRALAVGETERALEFLTGRLATVQRTRIAGPVDRELMALSCWAILALVRHEQLQATARQRSSSTAPRATAN